MEKDPTFLSPPMVCIQYKAILVVYEQNFG
jgi:hypothetical protein